MQVLLTKPRLPRLPRLPRQPRRKVAGLWTLVATLILLASAQPTAYGLDFPETTRLTLPEATNITASVTDLSEGAPLYSQFDFAQSLFASEMALVASVTQQVEMARNPIGAKVVARQIMLSEYNWGSYQFECLNRLWTKESHWNYKAHNYRSGAHGIAQALPANRMEIISSDWRKNPVTQIRWGLRYIEIRYENPCKAWAKFKRSKYY
ncbi:MAG: transglycosylase SLT domain-containing protein [Chthoniobacteraceae bacterium]|nr:transglycosylase SLT domain-containing protein [Chthoniobacteraceae bacterium]